jgi:predicted ester cyclase
MKIRTMLTVALALGATTFVGCKKKDKPEGSQKPNEGSSTTPTPGSDTTKPPPEPVKQAPLAGADLAKKYQACVAMVNGGKFDDLKKDCVAADFKGHEMDDMEIPDPAALVAFFQMTKTGFPDWKLEPQLIMVSGRNILAVNLVTGTNSADWKSMDGRDMKKTDKKIGQLMFHRLAINDENKATEEWAYTDPTTTMSQLGVLPKEVPPGRPAMDKGWDGAPIILVTADDAKEKANLEGMKKGTEAMNAHKVADAVAMWTDDAVESDQADGKDAKGKKEIEAGTKMFFTAFPDIKIEVENSYAAGDYVIALGTFSGTNKGAMGPMKATNKEVKGSYAEVVKVKDGKLAQVWRFRNGMAMAVQLGLIKADAGAPTKDATGPDAPKKDEPKKDEPKKDEPKKDEPKKDAPKKDAPKKDAKGSGGW